MSSSAEGASVIREDDQDYESMFGDSSDEEVIVIDGPHCGAKPLQNGNTFASSNGNIQMTSGSFCQEQEKQKTSASSIKISLLSDAPEHILPLQNVDIDDSLFLDSSDEDEIEVDDSNHEPCCEKHDYFTQILPPEATDKWKRAQSLPCPSTAKFDEKKSIPALGASISNGNERSVASIPKKLLFTKEEKITASDTLEDARRRNGSTMTSLDCSQKLGLLASAVSSKGVGSKRSFPVMKSQIKGVDSMSFSGAGLPTKKLRPDQYPEVDIGLFWRSLRNWDFLSDLNISMKPRTMKTDSGNDSDSDMEEIQPKPPTDTKSIVLPDSFDSHQQYKALWSPLQLGETKSQILSEFSSTLLTWSKSIMSVQVTTARPGSDDRYSESISLYLRASGGKRNVSVPIKTGGPGGGGVGSRQDFSVNDIVLLVADTASIESAFRGTLSVDAATSLLTYASPLGKSRPGVLGTVANRSKSIEGLVVNVSRRLWKSTVPAEMHLLRISCNVTALREFLALCNIGNIPLTKYLMASDLKRKRSLQSSPIADPLSETGGENSLGLGFRSYVHLKFNRSQRGAISAAAREYGDGGFTLIKGPPGTGKTTTLVALLNALHLRQYQRYYSEIERITTTAKTEGSVETLAAISAAANVKPRILVAAPSNAAVDNVILKIMEDRFVDGNGGKYSPSIVRVGIGQSETVASVSLKVKVDAILSEGISSESLESTITTSRLELKRLQAEVQNLQRRVRAIANVAPYSLSADWEIRIDEENFDMTGRVIFVNHALKTVSLTCPPQPQAGIPTRTAEDMPHYRSCMDMLVKHIERHNTTYSKLKQHIMVQNAAATINNGNYNQTSNELTQLLETHILDSMHIVMTTLGSAGSKTIESVSKFEVVLVDEAAQSSEPSTLVALQLGSSHAILVGDPQQLPATIFSVSGRITKYDRSLFQRLEEAGHPVHMLDTQYRMNPAISSFPRRIFYDGSLLDGPNVQQSDYGGVLSHSIKTKFPNLQPFTILDLDSVEERGGTSLWNTNEALLSLHLFCTLNQELQNLSIRTRVAIITPYSQQVALLHRTFADKFGQAYTKMVDISTIDAFQGKEASIVIISCVRAANRGVGIGFLSDVQRMNVALTRAKHFLFVIARVRTIQVNPYWRDLVGHAREQSAVLKVPLKRRRDGRAKGGQGNETRAPRTNGWKDELFPDLRKLKLLYPDNRLVLVKQTGGNDGSNGKYSA